MACTPLFTRFWGAWKYEVHAYAPLHNLQDTKKDAYQDFKFLKPWSQATKLKMRTSFDPFTPGFFIPLVPIYHYFFFFIYHYFFFFITL